MKEDEFDCDSDRDFRQRPHGVETRTAAKTIDRQLLLAMAMTMVV